MSFMAGFEQDGSTLLAAFIAARVRDQPNPMLAIQAAYVDFDRVQSALSAGVVVKDGWTLTLRSDGKLHLHRRDPS